jgi:hypothetical protein
LLNVRRCPQPCPNPSADKSVIGSRISPVKYSTGQGEASLHPRFFGLGLGEDDEEGSFPELEDELDDDELDDDELELLTDELELEEDELDCADELFTDESLGIDDHDGTLLSLSELSVLSELAELSG